MAKSPQILRPQTLSGLWTYCMSPALFLCSNCHTRQSFLVTSEFWLYSFLRLDPHAGFFARKILLAVFLLNSWSLPCTFLFCYKLRQISTLLLFSLPYCSPPTFEMFFLLLRLSRIFFCYCDTLLLLYHMRRLLLLEIQLVLTPITFLTKNKDTSQNRMWYQVARIYSPVLNKP